MIDNKEILEMFKNEIYDVMNDNVSFYKNYTFSISDEQYFIKDRMENNKRHIYIVVDFGSTTVNFGQSILPISMTVLSECNSIEVCKRLFIELVEKFNNSTNDSCTIKQFYTTPVVSANFNEMYDGFRSVISVSCTLLISENSNPFVLYYYSSTESEYVEIPSLSLSVANDIQLDTQVFYNNNNFSKSLALTASLLIKGSSYLLDNEIFNDMIKVMNKTNNINKDFSLKLSFKNSTIDITDTFKLAGCYLTQSIGDIPVINFTFAR